jgi:hypothetical protein
VYRQLHLVRRRFELVPRGVADFERLVQGGREGGKVWGVGGSRGMGVVDEEGDGAFVVNRAGEG